MRSMCGVKLLGKKLTKDVMQMLAINKTIDQLAKAHSVRWYGYVLRKEKNVFLRRALDLKVKGTRKMVDKNTWLKEVVEQNREVGLNTSDANNRSR